MKTATTLRFDSLNFANNEFQFNYLIDGAEKTIILSHSEPYPFPEEVVRHIGFSIGMCTLIDLAELVLPKKVEIFANLSEPQIQFWQKLYEDVAKEKMYAMNLAIADLEVPWIANPEGETFKPFTITNQKQAVALCLTGGKESLALLKMLKNKVDFSLFYLNLEKSVHRTKVYEKFKDQYPSIRTFSNRYQIINPLKQEYSNIYSGVDMAHLVFNTLLFADRYHSVLIGNEYSSNFPNEVYQGYPINHQFVKTIDFAKRINAYLQRFVTKDYAYHSPFFSLYEYRIADILFTDDEYFDVWTSCNQTTPEINFCSNCAKCAFTYLVARIRRDEAFLTHYFSRNLLEDVELFKPIMDFVGKKPLDCVGDKKEVWVALDMLAQKQVSGKVITYFLENIYPQIKDELPTFHQEINAIQQVPIHTPAYLTELVQQYLKEAK